MVTVTVDGKVYGTYDLEKSRPSIYKAGDKNHKYLKRFQTERQKCLPPIARDHHQQAISKKSDHRQCLPNKVVAEVTGNTKKDYDAVITVKNYYE